MNWPEHAERLCAEITEAGVEEWSKLDPERWVTESYAHALRHAYPVPESMVIEGDPEYVERSLKVIDERLKMGGVRLAALLNAICAGD